MSLSCPGCGADYRATCCYCGRVNEAPPLRMYAVSPETSREALDALRRGEDGFVFAAPRDGSIIERLEYLGAVLS